MGGLFFLLVFVLLSFLEALEFLFLPFYILVIMVWFDKALFVLAENGNCL